MAQKRNLRREFVSVRFTYILLKNPFSSCLTVFNGHISVFPPQILRTQQQWEQWWQMFSTRIHRFSTLLHNIMLSLLFTLAVNTVNKHQTVSFAAAPVCMCVLTERRVGFSFQMGAVISEALAYTVISIQPRDEKSPTRTEWKTLHSLTCCFHQWLRESATDRDEQRHCYAVSRSWQADEDLSDYSSPLPFTSFM